LWNFQKTFGRLKAICLIYLVTIQCLQSGAFCNCKGYNQGLRPKAVRNPDVFLSIGTGLV